MKTNTGPTIALPKRMSLVAQTVQSLSEVIRAGLWRDHLPGERALCERLQISRRTLRAALKEVQHQGWITVEGRKRRGIRSLSLSKIANAPTKIIGVLSPDDLPTLQPPTMLIMDALRDRLSQAGYRLAFHASRSCFSAKPAHALDKLIRQHPADAWLILGSKESMQRWFIREHAPCLVLGSCAPAIALPSMDVDYHATCRHAASVLWRRGHRRIALVLPRDAFGGDVASEVGMSEALHGFGNSHLRVLRHNGSTAHLCSLIDKVLRDPQPPTAYVVAHAMPVLTTLTHLQRRGKRIPQDVAVIARDDDPFMACTSPALAHYAISRVPIARRAATALRQLAETGTLPAKAIRLIPKFVAGDTVAER